VRVPAFEQSVFINCPFDEEYAPILEALLFCVIDLGFTPRIATESNDGAENRLDKIRVLIESSKFSIHDLSRAQARKEGEYYRLNMPFELGIDYGCRQYFKRGRGQKRILILEEKPYRYQASLSDLAGCDIQVHSAQYDEAIRQVRNWLVSESHMNDAPGASLIIGHYAAFQEWNFKRLRLRGFSDHDIKASPTWERMQAMIEWVKNQRPIGSD
jgi:hypothetical protein